MHKRISPTAILLSLFLGVGLLMGQNTPSVSFEKAYPAISVEKPVAVVIPPDDSDRLFLVQQRGQIRILPTDEASADAKMFLDLSDRKMEAHEFEEGLLGLVFHPDFKANRKFYVYYSQQEPKRSVISEMLVSADDPSKADVSSERIILEIPQPYWNHNSGNMIFGADGYLYIAVGDGGKGNDAARLAQNLFALNGKILRIDVNAKRGSREYGIPEDNPYMEKHKKTGVIGEKEGVRGEIWTSGMRNPWGLWLDPETNDMWCADVGQELAEEINLIHKGGNYGWSYREGTEAFPKRSDAAPEGSEFIEPIHTYGRADGMSITGGFVYQGDKMPALKGHYLYGDWRLGNMWALKQEGGKKTANHHIYKPEKPGKDLQPTAFCPDANGEVLVLDWKGGIYRMQLN